MVTVAGDSEHPYKLVRIDTIREDTYDFEPYVFSNGGWLASGQVVYHHDRRHFKGFHVVSRLTWNGKLRAADQRTVELHPLYGLASTKKRKAC